MIWTFIAIGVIILGFVLAKAAWTDGFFVLGALLFVFGIIGGIFVTVGLISTHSGVDAEIAKLQNNRQCLIMELSLIDSYSEDMRLKKEIIQEVAAWNREVISAKYWSKNLWTNWFFDSRLVDSLELIGCENESLFYIEETP